MKLNKTFKKSISIILTVIMIFSMMTVGMVSTNAATNITVYFTPTTILSKSYSYYKINVQYGGEGDGANEWEILDLTDTGNTQGGKAVYKTTIPVKYGGLNTMYVWGCNTKTASTATEQKNVFVNSWKSTSVFSGKLWNGSSWVPYNPDSTVDPTDPPVTTTNWYATGRFGVKSDNGTWTYAGGSATGYNATSTSIQFTKVSDTLYSLDTNATIKELSTHTSDNDRWYFKFYNGSTVYYTVNSTDVALTKSNAGTDYSTGTSTDKGFYFNDTTDESGNVILYLNTAGSTPVFYFEVEGDTPPTEKTWYAVGRFAVKNADGSLTWVAGESEYSENVTSNLKFTKVTNTSYKLETGFTMTELATYNAGAATSDWFLSFADGVNNYTSHNGTIDWKETDAGVSNAKVLGQGISSGILFTGSSDKYVTLWLDTTTETAPKVYFTLDSAVVTDSKDAYIATQGDGLWFDAAPSVTGTYSTLIKWNNYSGSSHTTTKNPYTLYIPKDVNLSSVVLYNGYDSALTINGTTIPANGHATVSLAETTYTTSGATSKSVKVMQGSLSSMYFHTTDKNGNDYDLPTAISSVDSRVNPAKKGSIEAKGGDCVTIDGSDISEPMVLSSVKGRGNSSWEASGLHFGKYAFNMKLDSATELFGLPKSKSFCLLANNADESMLRNALTYDLAKKVGLYDSPEFEFVDVYDNGEFLGTYFVCEKVDVAKKNKLIKGEAFDDINEEAVQDALNDPDAEVNEDTNSGTYTYNGQSYNMQYCTVGDSSVVSGIPSSTVGTYLLEFEIKKRVDGTVSSEPSWFKSPKGQYVVVKSPEFATKEQVEYVAKRFAEMEAEAYSSNATVASLSAHMDVDSFAKMYLIQELSSNLDAASTSYYITFDCSKNTIENGVLTDNAKFVASPVWDYDWAYGQYEKNLKKDVNGNPLDPANPEVWFAKNKSIGDSETQGNYYSLQSKLANNANFQTVIKKVWNGTSGTTDGFYNVLKNYFGDNKQLDKWYAQIKDSMDMNEFRWGFIASDKLSSSGANWGSKDTGDTLSATVQFLENWIQKRSLWLNDEFAAYGDYTQFSTPTLKAYASDGETELTGSVDEGTEFVLKAITTETYVTYELYEGSTKIATNTTGEFTISDATEGTHSYTVKTIYGSSTKTSSAISVNVLAVEKVNVPNVAGMTQAEATTALTEAGFNVAVSEVYDAEVEIGKVIASTPAGGTQANMGSTVTIKVSKGPAPAKVNVPDVVGKDLETATAEITDAGLTFSVFYEYNETVPENTVISSNPTAGAEVEKGATVKVIVSKGPEPSTEPTLPPGEELENVKVYFKGTNLKSLTPSLTINGKAYALTMDKENGYIGTYYNGSYRFYWWTATIPTVTVGESYEVVIKTSGSSMNAVGTINFSTCNENNEIYLAVDNMQTGSTFEDITNNDTAKKSFRSSANMITNVENRFDPNKTLAKVMMTLFNTDGTTSTKKMSVGDTNADGNVNIKDATLAQMMTAGIVSGSDTNNLLGDYDISGDVNIKDATGIQSYIVNY